MAQRRSTSHSRIASRCRRPPSAKGTEALDRTLQGSRRSVQRRARPIRRRCSASPSRTGRMPLPRRSVRGRSRSTVPSRIARRPSPIRSPSGARRSNLPSVSRPRPWTGQLADRTQQVTTSLTERLQSIDNAFGQRAGEIDRVLAEHARAVEATFGRQASHLNELARQQLSDDQADCRPGRGAVQGSDRRAHGADAGPARRIERLARADPQPDPALREPRTGDPDRRQGARIRRTPRSTRSWRAAIRPSSASCTRSTPRAPTSTI